jgi:hypothetical protein
MNGIPGWPHLQNLKDIPTIFQALGWTEAAHLLNEWFNSAKNTNPLAAMPDTTTITMAWLHGLGISRADEAYNRIVNEKLWLTDAAKTVLAERLKHTAKLGRHAEFGNLSLPVPTLDGIHIQTIHVGNPIADPLDELMATLGRFELKVVASGSVRSGVRGNTPVYTVRIEEVGIYVKDSFDFSGDQYLGCFDPVNNGVSKYAQKGYYQVTNEDFRNWSTSMGMNFLIYSDMERLVQTPPDEFDIR